MLRTNNRMNATRESKTEMLEKRFPAPPTVNRS